MKKWVTVATLALSLTLLATEARAQTGRGPRGTPAGNGGGLRIYGYQPVNGGYAWQNFYGYTYPYNTASATFSGGNWQDYFVAPPDMPGFYSGPAAPPYGSGAYSLLRQMGNDSPVATPRAPVAESSQPATVRVLLPDASARVTFDDSATRATGTERTFSTPALDADKSYTYTIRATWTQDGKEISRSKDVKVNAGREATVDFRQQ